MRQPDDVARFRTEEADGADDVLDVLGIRGGKLRRTGIFAEQFRRDHVHALVGGLRAQHRSHQQFERRIEVQRAFRIGNLHAQLLVFLMHARDPRLLRFPRHASSLPLACGRTRKTYGNVAIGKKQRKSIEKTTENQQKNNRKSAKGQRKQTKPVEHQRNDRKKKVSFRRTRREPHPWPRPHAHPLPADRNDSRRCARCR